MKNIKLETIRENLKGGKRYILFKISIDTDFEYCIAVQDSELSVCGTGNDIANADEIYGILSSAEVSSIHINDVIRDMQNEIFM
jgi:hypothetical protein